MLKSTDIIRLPYPAELTQTGIAIASRKLASGSIPDKNIDIQRFRLEVVQASVTLAILRYLLDQHIPFQYQKYRPFTQPEQATIVLGGRKCEIETSLITDLNTARQLSRSPRRILETSIHIPAEMQTSSLHSASDLAVFASAVARVNENRSVFFQLAEAREPFRSSYMMPEDWRHPGRRKALGQLSFCYAGESGIILDLYGLDSHQEHCVERITVYPQTWVASRYQYSTLSCLHADALPTAKMEIRRQARRGAYTIMPLQWRNLWVYGQEIILIGYLTFEEIWDMTRAAPAKLLGPIPDLEVSATSLHALPAFLELVAQQQMRA